MSEKPGQKKISRREFVQGAGALTAASLLGSHALAQQSDQTIVRAAIHPAIGVARVGGSDEYFIGPEVVNPKLTLQGESRDAAHNLKRQAARFRVYGYNAAGRVVRELTTSRDKIEWHVHLANKKAAWYRFIAALDIKESEQLHCLRRNNDIIGEDRKTLIIDAQKQRISGIRQRGPILKGSFRGEPVTLGDLLTDGAGRLLVLGGKGKAGNPPWAGFPKGKPIYAPADPDTFNNADGWWDDISDGSVEATVTIDGKTLPTTAVESAWVFVAPPNYARDIIGWRTLYDLLMHTLAPKPTTTSFTDDIVPVLHRLANLQWVNAGILKNHPRGSDYDFTNPKILARLNDPKETGLRRDIYNLFRVSSVSDSPLKTWPTFYGDSYGSSPADTFNNHFMVPAVTAEHLTRWKDGEFESDWTPEALEESSLDRVRLQKQPQMLDRAALHFCLADAFHPGCEVTWPMRFKTMYRPLSEKVKGYQSPFRILQRTAGEREVELPEELSAEDVLQKNGPLYGQQPGDLTRWMAMPWHGDTAYCRSGYEPLIDPFLPTFWPARVPNQVLSAEDFAIVIDKKRYRKDREAAYARRVHWTRFLKGDPPTQMIQMVAEFNKMGVVEAYRWKPDLDVFPPVLFVETLPPELQAETKGVPRAYAAATAAPLDEYQKAGWKDKDEYDKFNAIRVRPRVLR